MAYDVTEDSNKTLISKWGSRKTGIDIAGNRCRMKQIVIKHRQGYKRKDGKTAYRSETRHIPA